MKNTFLPYEVIVVIGKEGESLLHDVILNGRSVIAAPKQYFRKPRCHGLKNLEDEARAISTEAKKGL